MPITWVLTPVHVSLWDAQPGSALYGPSTDGADNVVPLQDRRRAWHIGLRDFGTRGPKHSHQGYIHLAQHVITGEVPVLP
eukprot:scaffold433262_cov56-Prasinocladus_malaysianus.AAC.1